jgi:hemoglobin-like flavoprotein
MKKLIITLLLLGIGSLNAQQRRPFLPKPPPEKPEIVKGLFGQWLDKDGYITDGPKIKNWVDSDRDRIDDRFQAGPGKPAGKKHPEVGKPKPDLQPEVIPQLDKDFRKPKKEDSEKEISLDKAPEEVRQAVMNFIKTNGGKIEEVSVEKEDGELIYEVEIDAPNGVEYELEISAKGKIIKEEREEKRKSKKPKAEKPERPARPEVSDEIKDKLDSYKKEKKALGDELKKAIKDLEKPSRKAVKELMEVFHTTHKVRFDAQKELGNAIKEGLAQNRPERPKKPEVSAEVKKLHKSHADKIKELHESKKKLMTSLKDVKGDERKKLLDGFREEQKSLHNELKSIQKQLREQIVICTLPKDNKPTKERVERRPPPRPESKEKNTESRRPTGR